MYLFQIYGDKKKRRPARPGEFICEVSTSVILRGCNLNFIHLLTKNRNDLFGDIFSTEAFFPKIYDGEMLIEQPYLYMHEWLPLE